MSKNRRKQDSGSPTVSVVVPMRNEEEYAERCLLSLLNQTYPADRFELIVVDGDSSDDSREIVQRLQQSYARLRLLHNPTAIVPTSMNIGIQSSTADIIVRADAHTIYPPDYIENSVSVLEQTKADNVGGPIRTVPGADNFSAQLAAVVISSRFGVGNSRFRTSTKEGYVDTVPFGAFRRDLFDRVGFFNEQLVRNQDNELNARIRKAGGKIYLSPCLTTNYFAPAKFPKLLQQTYRNAKWHFFTLRHMRSALGFRHLLPAGFLLNLLVLTILALIAPWARIALAGILLLYVTSAFILTLGTSGTPWSIRLTLPFAFFAFHISYGVGTLAGLQYVVNHPGAKPLR
jgi:cellulose synthase/poly-beta-1,6-N-acetylglucosamine synthase-like glycosyltransferase